MINLIGSKLDKIKANINHREILKALNLDRVQSEVHTDVLGKAKISYTNTFNPEFFCRLSRDFRFTFVNDALTFFYRLKPENILGKNLFSIIPYKYHSQASATFISLNCENNICTCEYMFKAANGQLRWRQWTTQAIFNEMGELLEYQCIGRDITEQKEAQEQLLYRLTLEETVAFISKLFIGPENPDLHYILELIGKVLDVNRTYIFELQEDGLKRASYYEWCAADSMPRSGNLPDLRNFSWGPKHLSNDGIIIIPDLESLPPEASWEKSALAHLGVKAMLLLPVHSTQGNLLGYIGLEDSKKIRNWQFNDIQCLSIVSEMLGAFLERRHFENALRVSEEKFRTLAETAPAIIFVWSDPDTKAPIVYLNSAFESITGYNVTHSLFKSCWDFIHPDSREMARERGLARIQGRTDYPDRYEVKFYKKDSIGWGDLSVSPIMWEGKPAVMGIIYDITKRKKIEEELCKIQNKLEARVKERTNELLILNEKLQQEIMEHTQSDFNFRKLADNCPALVYIFSKDRLLYLNSTARLIAGCNEEEIGDINPWTFVHPDFRAQMRQVIKQRYKGQTVAPYETKLISRNGQEVWACLSADTIEYQGQQAILGIIVDITERKKMEEELIKASKLESLGILAGGIAHDFNNILTIISGNISLAKMIIDPDHEIKELLHEVDQATSQARDLTQQLLTFSKGGAPIKEAASIQELLKESASFVLRGSNVNCKFSIPDHLWTVVIDKGQFNQVINNVIINADQAMPDGGTIHLSAENVYINNENSYNSPGAPFIKIRIADQGTGIAEDQLDKVFDPYFTTKQKGHGLGLPTCYSIIKKHGGDIRINSQIRVGTAVEIFLPACPEIFVEKRDRDKIPLSGNGKILIMDDEEMVRETLGKMLIHLGYDVIYAADGFEAVELYQKVKNDGFACEAVIMDLTIAGGMGGKEAVKRMLELDPQARVIVSSGYSNDPVMANYEQYGFCGVIPKPYEIEKLNEVLFQTRRGHENQ